MMFKSLISQKAAINCFSKYSMKFSIINSFAFATTQRDWKITKLQNEKIRETGNMKLRSVLMKQDLDESLLHLENNIHMMSQVDYQESIILLSNKIENSFKTENSSLRLNPAIIKINEYINKNIENITDENSIFVLQYILALRTKNVFIFHQDTIRNYTKKAKSFFEENESKLEINFKLFYLSVLGDFTPIRKDYFDDAKDISDFNNYQFLYKIFRRVSEWEENYNESWFFLRKFDKKFIQLALEENLINRSKAFSVFSNLKKENFNHKLVNDLIKSILKDFQNSDERIILNLLSGLVHYRGSLKLQLFSEITELIRNTIARSNEILSPSFIIKFTSVCAEDIGYDLIQSVDVWEAIFDYIETNSHKFIFNENILNVPLLMFKTKIFNQNVLTIILEKLSKRLIYFPIGSKTRVFRNIVKNILGEKHLELMRKNVSDQIHQEFQNPNIYASKAVDFLGKFFFYNSNVDQKLVDLTIKRIIDAPVVDSTRLLLNYIQIQDNVNSKVREVLVKEVVNIIYKYNKDEIPEQNQFRMFLNINSLYFSNKHADETSEKIKNLNNLIIESKSFKDSFLRKISKLNQDVPISNFTLIKIVTLIRNLVKSNEFIQNSPMITGQLYLFAYNILSNKEKFDVEVEIFQNLISFADYLHKKDQPLGINFAKIIQIFKLFNSFDIEGKAITQELYRLVSSDKFNLNHDSVDLVFELLNTYQSINDKRTIVENLFKNDLFELFNKGVIKSNILQLVGFANRLFPNIVGKELVEKFVSHNLKLIDESKNNFQKINQIFSMTHIKTDSYEAATQEKLFKIIKEVSKTLPFKFFLKNIEKIRSFNNEISKKLGNEFLGLYLKEQIKDKSVFLRVLDVLGDIKIVFVDLINKIIDDYENLNQNLNAWELLQIIENFAKLNFKKDDLIDSIISRINLRNLENVEKISLFNNLCKLGYSRNPNNHKQIKKIIEDVDIPTIMDKPKLDVIIETITSIESSKDILPDKYEKNIDFLVNLINNEFKQNILRFNQNQNYNNEKNLILAKISNIYNKLDEELKTSFGDRIEKLKNLTSQKKQSQIFKELLKIGGINEFLYFNRVVPANFVIEDKKVAIFILNSRDTINLSKEPTLIASVYIKKCQELGYKVITVYGFELNEKLKDKDYKQALSLLKEKGIDVTETENPDLKNFENLLKDWSSKGKNEEIEE